MCELFVYRYVERNFRSVIALKSKFIRVFGFSYRYFGFFTVCLVTYVENVILLRISYYFEFTVVLIAVNESQRNFGSAVFVFELEFGFLNARSVFVDFKFVRSFVFILFAFGRITELYVILFVFIRSELYRKFAFVTLGFEFFFAVYRVFLFIFAFAVND